VKVSRICLGTATFGVAPTAQDADRTVGAAIDLGINFVDAADVYGNMPVFDRPGAPAAADRDPAEQILGGALRGRRDQMVIATKSNGIVGLDINDRGLSRRHIIRQVETSLRRLETRRVGFLLGGRSVGRVSASGGLAAWVYQRCATSMTTRGARSFAVSTKTLNGSRARTPSPIVVWPSKSPANAAWRKVRQPAR
jgi:hypothetical protein